MTYEDPSLSEFRGYFKAKEPGRRERAEAWATAIGLQKVDGLSVSRYLVETAKEHIEGRITQAQARRRIHDYYEAKDEQHQPDPELLEPDKVAERIAANYADYPRGVKREWGYLEAFFRNLLLGEKNELKSRYLLIGIDRPPPRFGDGDVSRVVRKSGKKKAVRKSGKKTVERVWELLRDQPQLTFAGMVAALGITRSTIQKHIANLKATGRLRRIGPDKGGHWEVNQ